MRIRKIYISDDGREFQTRHLAIFHERDVRSEASGRRREEKFREKQRVSLAKRQEKENILRDRLVRVFGETINPAISVIVQNRSMIRRVLTGRC